MRTNCRTFLALALCADVIRADELLATSGPVNPNLLKIDPSTGSVLSSFPVTNEEALFGGLTLDGDQLYSIDGYNDPNSDRTFRIDPATGVGTVVGDTTFNWNFRSVEIHPVTGALYGRRDNELFVIDKVGGAAASVAPITGATLNQATALAIDLGGQAYVTDTSGQGLFALDLGTGTATHLGDLAVSGSGWFQDLAFDSSGTLWGVFFSGGVYRIDIGTPSTALAFASPGYAGIAFRCDSPATTYCTAKPGLACGLPAVRSAGCSSASAASGFLISAGPARAQKSGLLIYTDAGPANLPFQGAILCVAPPLRRSAAVASGGTVGACNGVFSLDVNCFAAGQCGGNPAGFLLVPGTQVNCQWWGRDSVATGSFLSDGAQYSVGP